MIHNVTHSRNKCVISIRPQRFRAMLSDGNFTVFRPAGVTVYVSFIPIKYINVSNIYRPQSRKIMYLVASIRPFVCLCALSWLQQRATNPDYQSKGIVCVSVISGIMRIIVRMRSIGF